MEWKQRKQNLLEFSVGNEKSFEIIYSNRNLYPMQMVFERSMFFLENEFVQW